MLYNVPILNKKYNKDLFSLSYDNIILLVLVSAVAYPGFESIRRKGFRRRGKF